MRYKLVTFDDLNTDLTLNKRGISIAISFSCLHVAGCDIGVRISVSSSLHQQFISKCFSLQHDSC